LETPEISVVIPFCDAFDGKATDQRVEAIDFAIELFYSKHKNIEVILVCQNSCPLHPLAKIAEIDYPVFNKGWCVNVGARVARGKYLCIAETDMYAAVPFLNDVPPYMAKNGSRWCFCWDSLEYTTKEGRADVIMNDVPPGTGMKVNPSRGLSEGGMVMFERDFFMSIGGCNEWFEELGGPDNELARRAEAVSGTYKMYPMEVIHLWHPKCREKYRPSRMRNIALYRSTCRHPLEFSAFLAKQDFGNPKKPLIADRNFKQAWEEWKNEGN
jgi:hypothetical protein